MVWETSNWSVVFNQTRHTQTITSLDWNPRRDVIVTGGEDNKIIVWDIQNGKMLHEIEGIGVNVLSVAWNWDGTLFTSSGVSVNNSIAIHAFDGTLLKDVQGHNNTPIMVD